MKIVVYSKDKCPKCHATMRFLDANDMPFEEKNISHDDAAYQEAVDSGFTSAPVIQVDGEMRFSGFDVPKLHQLAEQVKEN